MKVHTEWERVRRKWIHCRSTTKMQALATLYLGSRKKDFGDIVTNVGRKSMFYMYMFPSSDVASGKP